MHLRRCLGRLFASKVLYKTDHVSQKMNEYTQARCRAAENAALLVCLKEQPAIPRENTHAIKDTSNPLSLSYELRLVEDFSFISSTKDDPNGVTAVCMETDRDGAGVTLRIAANTGCLSHVVEELQVVADIMVRASRHGRFEMTAVLVPC